MGTDGTFTSFSIRPGPLALFSTLDVLLQQLSQLRKLFLGQGALRNDVETGRRGVKENLIFSLRRPDVVLPIDVA